MPRSAGDLKFSLSEAGPTVPGYTEHFEEPPYTQKLPSFPVTKKA